MTVEKLLAALADVDPDTEVVISYDGRCGQAWNPQIVGMVSQPDEPSVFVIDANN